MEWNKPKTPKKPKYEIKKSNFEATGLILGNSHFCEHCGFIFKKYNLVRSVMDHMRVSHFDWFLENCPTIIPTAAPELIAEPTYGCTGCVLHCPKNKVNEVKTPEQSPAISTSYLFNISVKEELPDDNTSVCGYWYLAPGTYIHQFIPYTLEDEHSLQETKNNLKIETTKHKYDMKYKCDMCPYQAKDRRYIWKHKKNQSCKKCVKCDKYFEKNKMKAHVLGVHRLLYKPAQKDTTLFKKGRL